MREILPKLIFIAGIGQLCVLVASAMVPIQLRWHEVYKDVTRLHRQMIWVYGGYVVLSIVSLGLISLFNAEELASGTRLARSVSAYCAVFWGVRLSLQPFLDVKEHFTRWWLAAGYYLLTVFFLYFTTVYALAALLPTTMQS
jgi:hypothetical protein